MSLEKLQWSPLGGFVINLQVFLSPAETVNSSDITSPDVCNMSVYAATKDQRYLSSGGSNVIAAVMVGLILGIIFVAGIVLLQLFLDSQHASQDFSHRVPHDTSQKTSHDIYTHKPSDEPSFELSHDATHDSSHDAPQDTSHDASQEKK